MCHNKRCRQISDEKCHKHIRIVQTVVAFVSFGLRPFHFRKLRIVICFIGICFNLRTCALSHAIKCCMTEYLVNGELKGAWKDAIVDCTKVKGKKILEKINAVHKLQ